MSDFGITAGVPAVEYHKREVGVVSKSALDAFARSPKHYLAWLDGDSDKSTPALEFGTAFHMALLEPERFAKFYAVAPHFGDLRTKEGKLARDNWLDANTGKTMLNADDSAAIGGMLTAIRQHPAASRIVTEGTSEVTVRWTDEASGLRCKSRADYYVAKRALVVDVKTTTDASPDQFKRSVVNYRYHVQDALYRSGFAACGQAIDHFAILAVEKTYPYCVAVYTLDADAVTRGYAAARQGIDNMRHCINTDNWPGYGDDVQELSLPAWAA